MKEANVFHDLHTSLPHLTIFKEPLEMPQLPSTRSNQYYDLRQAVPHRPCIRGLAEIPVICLSLPLVLLLPVYILELLVQVADF